MHDMHNGADIDALAAKVDELALVCARLSRENAELRSQVSALSRHGLPGREFQGDWVPVTRMAPADGTAPAAGGMSVPDGVPALEDSPAWLSRRAVVGVALTGAAVGIAGATALTERSNPAAGSAVAARTAAPAGITASVGTSASARTGASAGTAEFTAEEATAAAPTATGSVIAATLSSASAVVSGTNTNSGPGVSGTNTSAGSGVTGTNTSAGSGVSGFNWGSGPAIAGHSSGTGPGMRALSGLGRGGIFAGGAAQIQLAPGGATHPRSGQLGDLYADAAGRLWFCKKSGAAATWHQIA